MAVVIRVMVLALAGALLPACPDDTPGTTTTTTTATTMTPTSGEPGADMGGGAPICAIDGCVTEYEGEVCQAEYAECLAGDTLCSMAVVVFAAADDPAPVVPDPASARCFLAALRDRQQGRLELRWGIPFQNPYIQARIWSRGDGTVLLQADWVLWDIGGVSHFAVTDALEIRPPAYFQACIDDGSEAALVACLVGGLTTNLIELPWLTGACTPFAGC